VTSRIDPIGRETAYTYAANGIDVTAITQSSAAGAGSQIGAFTYNAHHQPLTVTDAAGKTTSYTYNKLGQVLSVTNALSQTTKFTYNAKGYLTTITGADGKIKESLTYDNVGRVASETDSQGYSVTSSYDNLDRLTRTGYPDGTSVSYKYTKLDVTSITDRLGRVTSLAYDSDRNLIATTDPLGRTINYRYDPDGRLISLTDAAEHTTKWTYDLEGRVTAKTFPDGTSVKYAYDQAGRMITRTDALGQVTNYTYTTDDRVAGVSYTNAKNPTAPVSFAWDSTYPRIDSMTDGTGATSYAYVPPGQNGALELASETGPAGSIATYNYSYDAIGRANKLLAAGALLGSSSFDTIGRPTTEMTALGQFNIGYLGETAQVSSVTALGQVVAGANGLTSFGYLPNTGDRRLSGISYNAAPASGETITTDDAGRVMTRTDGTGKSETYKYDAADRLVSGSVTGVSPAYTESYGYNKADIITSKSGEPVASNNWTVTSTGSTNEISTLTPSGGLGRTYSYDADGEVLSDGVRKYTWDAENRLLTISEIASGHLTTFTYDGNGRRVGITETTGGSSTTTNYLWCGSVLCSAYAAGSTVASYPGFGEVRYTGGTATDYFYNTDHLGTVTSMTNAAGATVGTLATDAFGLTLSSSGTTPTFGYAGMFLQQPTSSIPPLYLTLNRVYDPYAGTWLSRDPSGEAGGLNLYGYVSESPTNGVDLIGLCGPLDNLLNFLSSIGGDAADAAGLALEVLATEILLGGPEDPIADFLVAEELAGDAGIDAVGTEALAEEGSEGLAESAEAGTTTGDAAESADVLADAPAEAEAPEEAEGEGAGAAGEAGDASAEKTGAGCFKAGTLVTTSHGQVPIEKIKVGDLVEARDPVTGKTAFEPVLRVYVHYKKVVDDITFVGAAGQPETIVATPEHPFHATGIGWVGAGHLKPGEHIDDLTGAALVVRSVAAETGTQTVYNLDVANFHTYFVGKDQAWVHNACNPFTIGAKILKQMGARGWSKEAIAEARASGQQIRAVNKATGNAATRFIHPGTGQSVVIDNVTGEVIHVGGPGFTYGPGSGDVP
jgi:RHS repeat-associated protein